VGKVYPPFGLVAGATTNPLQLTIEQALAAMTFWGAYMANMEAEAGALAVPAGAGQPGWFADLVVWRYNPLAIQGPGGMTVEALARTPGGTNDAARLATVNAFISKFLPRQTVVGGRPVYQSQ
jgi:predicted amidohydrolase YtcJ